MQARQIVSAIRIKQMTAPHGLGGWWFGFARSYGYLWWLGRSSIDSRASIGSAALAGAGSGLYVVPDLSLFIAVTAGLYGSSQGGSPSPQENRRHGAEFVRIARRTRPLTALRLSTR